LIVLPQSRYDVVGSIVVYKTDVHEVEQSIRQFLAVPLETHLCIIDNSPKPLELPQLSDPRISYYFANSNLGYGRAHNIALRASHQKARYNLVMNTDVTYTPEVVTRLVEFMNSKPKAGLAAPKVLYPDGSLQHVCRLLPTPTNLLLRRFLPSAAWTRRADALYELRWWDHQNVANIPYFQGSFLMLRTPLCQRLGGFDERFFLYGEDIDLTRRMHGLAETLYVPEVNIIHQYRRLSSRSLLGTWYGIQNNCRYFNKWGWFFDRERQKINARATASLRAGPTLADRGNLHGRENAFEHSA
jgi:GT2 family glycosyltransferase